MGEKISQGEHNKNLQSEMSTESAGLYLISFLTHALLLWSPDYLVYCADTAAPQESHRNPTFKLLPYQGTVTCMPQ